MARIPKLIFILNSSPDVLFLLQQLIDSAGFFSVAIPVDAFQDDDLADFIAAHRPEVVVMDVPWPFEHHAARLESFRDDPRTAGVTWVALSLSEDILSRLDGARVITGSRPFDVEEVIAAVARAAGIERPSIEGPAPGSA